MLLKGRIHSFETFGTLDGPGIRFVVFMQGCPLRCLYCHNRDTRDIHGGKEYAIGEVMEKLKKYSEFIRLSNGGITVTGGEPTMQAEFVTGLFRKCKEAGIHTALDTSGHTDVQKVLELLEYTDLVLLDLKQAIEEKHRKLTGVGSGKIKKFAYYVSSLGIPIWIRYVLVPGFTDAKEDLLHGAAFIRSLESVKRVDVLPYHSMGRFKWERAGEPYPLAEVKEPAESEVEQARKILTGMLPGDQTV